MTASVKVTHVRQAGLSSGVTCLLSGRVCVLSTVRALELSPTRANTDEENAREEDFAVKYQAC